MLNQRKELLLWGNPNYWVFPGATLDLDFANGRYYQQGGSSAISSILTTVRATTRLAVDTSGNWSSFANNIPAITNNGLAVAQTSTNGIRNNSMQGASPGTSGNYPTFWSVLNSGGCTYDVVGSGVENGIDYVDIRCHGTSAGANLVRFAMDTNSGISAVNTNTLTSSCFMKLVGGDFTNCNQAGALFWSYNNTGTSLNIYGSYGALPTGAALSSQRFTSTATITDATAAFAQPFWSVSFNGSGLAIDFTIRIGWPQLEQAVAATPPIRTTNAAGTRNVDSITMPTGTWYSTSAGTIIFSGFVNATPGNIRAPFYLYDGSDANRMAIYQQGTSTTSVISVASVNNINANAGSNAIAAGVKFKTAIGDDGTTAVISTNGVSGTGGAVACNFAAMNSLRIGTWTGNSNALNGYVGRLTYFPALIPQSTINIYTT